MNLLRLMYLSIPVGKFLTCVLTVKHNFGHWKALKLENLQSVAKKGTIKISPLASPPLITKELLIGMTNGYKNKKNAKINEY